MAFATVSTTLHASLTDVETPHVADDIATDAITSIKILNAAVIAAKLFSNMRFWQLDGSVQAINVSSGVFTEVTGLTQADMHMVRWKLENNGVGGSSIQLRVNENSTNSYSGFGVSGTTPFNETGVNRSIVGQSLTDFQQSGELIIVSSINEQTIGINITTVMQDFQNRTRLDWGSFFTGDNPGILDAVGLTIGRTHQVSIEVYIPRTAELSFS